MSLAVQTPVTKPQPHRWSREEFYQMVELGWFEGRNVEFMDGEIIEMPPQGPPHALCILKITKLLERVFAQGYCVRPQLPLSLQANGDPNPDVAVVSGAMEDFGTSHPDSAELVVEVSESTLSYDRREKASMYAKAGIADYWIVNLQDRQVEVRRNPAADSSQHHGFGYRDSTILKPGDFVSPLAAPQARILVADLLP
jgi:Uma2 family endonuclease